MAGRPTDRRQRKRDSESPRGIITEHLKETKRPRRDHSASSTRSSVTRRRLEFSSAAEKNTGHVKTSTEQPKKSILNYISDDFITAQIFAFVGPFGTAHCASVCRGWNAVSKKSSPLWRNFVEQDFRFTLKTPPSNTRTLDVSVGKKENGAPINWKAVYSYLVSHKDTDPSRLDGTVAFADDGGNFGGRYPAANALRPEGNLVWCTNTGVDKNVDLVVELEKPSLITGFVAANGGRGYSAPLKEALVFVSMDPPNLKASRAYNGSNGRNWVKRLMTLKKQEEPDSSTQDFEHTDQTSQSAEKPRVEDIEETSEIQPVAAFELPALPEAYDAKSSFTLDKPRVGQYIHFKLLSSFSPSGLEHISDNIDVMHLHTHGVRLEQLTELVPIIPRPLPEYERQHALRASRIELHERFGFFL